MFVFLFHQMTEQPQMLFLIQPEMYAIKSG
jgi:hypothetical protein